MTLQIEAILFDMGGTLRRSIQRNETEKRQRIGQIRELIGSNLEPDELLRLLTERARAYKEWAQDTEVELSEEELWTRWMLPDIPAAQVAPLAMQLNQIWRSANSQYIVLPEAREVILALFRRGYRLGLVSNTTSSVEAPQLLEDLEVSGCFETVVLSCKVGRRKPDPEILLSATRRMGIQPQCCAYVGDLPYRDVQASYHAGFARSIIISDTLEMADTSCEPALKPHHIIRNLRELLALFPPRMEIQAGGNGRAGGAAQAPVCEVSFSTMWAMHNFPGLEDFFVMAGRSGFANLELNHQVNSKMLAGIDLRHYRFTSVHEPCPADISTHILKDQDWLISSTDEERRKIGVEAVRKSIRLAKELGAKAIVIHAGMVRDDWSAEKTLYNLYASGGAQSPEYQALKQSLIERRTALARPHLAAVKKSLLELLEDSAPLGIRLGLENRFHYVEIPAPDELEELLCIAAPEQVGFWYDVGHAQVLDRLGFFAHAEWLERFGGRIVGTHLHDATGINDHQAPGFGEVDFERVARSLPAGAIRTLEVRWNTPFEQVKDGLHFLAEKGILQCHP